MIDAVNTIGGDWFFMTLTAHEKARTRDQSLINLQKGWKRLVERIRRQSDEKVHYARIYELHRNGRVHMHFITNWRPKDYRHPASNAQSGSRWLKDNARQCGMGYQVRIERLDGHAGLVAAYVTKYITKSLERLPAGIRKIQTTQGFKQKVEIGQSEYEWQIFEKFTERDYLAFKRTGYNVRDIARDKTVNKVDFDNGDYAPF